MHGPWGGLILVGTAATGFRCALAFQQTEFMTVRRVDIFRPPYSYGLSP